MISSSSTTAMRRPVNIRPPFLRVRSSGIASVTQVPASIGLRTLHSSAHRAGPVDNDAQADAAAGDLSASGLERVAGRRRHARAAVPDSDGERRLVP